MEEQIVAKIATAIEIASDNDTLMKLDNEASLIKDEALRLGLVDLLKARRKALGIGKKDGKLDV